MTPQSPITKQGLKKIQQDLDHLLKVEREKIKKSLQEARELGDLKENAEYHAAKEKQALNEGKISQLQSLLATSKVVDTSSIISNKIVFGATVRLYDCSKAKTVEYQIVGEYESTFAQGLISYTSPLGRALIGKTSGDIVTVKVPKGDIEYEVRSFEYK